MPRPGRAVLLLAALVLASCTAPERPSEVFDGTDTATAVETESGPARAVEAPEGQAFASVSSPGGVTAEGTIDVTAPAREVEVGPRAWVLGLPTVEGSVSWLVVADDGATHLVTEGPDGPSVTATTSWDPVRPPVQVVREGEWVAASTDGAGPVAPATVTSTGWRVVVDPDGDLLLDDGADDVATVAGPFLPDAHPVELPDGRVAVLAGPTDAYGHGVLGDAVEATAVAIVDPAAAEVVERLEPAPGRVIEGTAPLVGDVDGDGADDLVVTTSADADGARLEAWPLDGGPRLVGPAIGRGSRWRHQVAVAPAPGGDGNAVVEVVTPHLDRVAQWLVPDDGALVPLDDRVGGVASHRLGSRNLQQAAVVDVDGDGDRELVGPDREGDALLVVDRDPVEGTSTLGIPLGSAITSNLALVGEGDALTLAVVTADGTLHVWG